MTWYPPPRCDLASCRPASPCAIRLPTLEVSQRRCETKASSTIGCASRSWGSSWWRCANLHARRVSPRTTFFAGAIRTRNWSTIKSYFSPPTLFGVFHSHVSFSCVCTNCYKYRNWLCDTFYQKVPSLTKLRTPYVYCSKCSFQSEYMLLKISHRMGLNARSTKVANCVDLSCYFFCQRQSQDFFASFRISPIFRDIMLVHFLPPNSNVSFFPKSRLNASQKKSCDRFCFYYFVGNSLVSLLLRFTFFCQNCLPCSALSTGLLHAGSAWFRQ